MNKNIGIFLLIGARLREERKLMSLSQAEFAALAGATRISQGAYENGKYMPNLEYLILLAQHGVDIGYIVTGVRHDGRLGNDQVTILKCYDQMDDSNRVAFLQIAQGLATLPGPPKSIPVDHTTPPTLHDPATPYKAEPRDA